MIRKLKLREKILIATLACALGALLVQTLLFVRVSGNIIYEQAEKENEHTFENMQNELNLHIKNIETSMIEIYKDSELLNDLDRGMSAEELREHYQRRAETLARGRFSTSDEVLALYLYNQKHEIISTYRRASTPKHNYPKDIYEFDGDPDYNTKRVRDYVNSNDNNMLISSYYNPYREKNIARFVVKIHSTSDISKKIGYVVCDTDIKALQKMMKKYVLNDESFIWLQPMGDNLILSLGDIDILGEDIKKDFINLSNSIAAGNVTEAVRAEHASNVLFKSSQKKYNMDVYCIMPEEILKHNQTLLTENLIYIGLILVIILVLLIWYLTHSITKPLEQLTDTVTKIGAGQTNLRATYVFDNEIGTLGKEFNHMLDEIESYIGREYETRLLLNQAEYKALQSQINPHFLYNTLDTMSSIASIQNCELVSSLCQSLSNIFRYSLDIKHPYSTLANEINHLKNYIYVMNVRMREEIKYRFYIDDTLLSDSIPRISLQPLVENALNHGLKNKHGEKWIEIRACKAEENQIMVSVSDNGVGMDAEEMNILLERNDRDRVESGNSIGIYNINARLKMLYGDNFGMHVESKVGEGTTVILRIPRKKIEELQ